MQDLCNQLGGKAEICLADVSKQDDCKYKMIEKVTWGYVFSYLTYFSDKNRRIIDDCITHFFKIDILVSDFSANIPKN